MNPRFHDLFQWRGERFEDARFWCEPALTAEAMRQIPERGFPAFDGIASFEARGFYLAGIASAFLGLPVVLIRKHKPFYEKMRHAKVELTNWKGERESLVVLKDSLPACKRVLVVDDIFDTGRSLQAGERLLHSLGVEIAGAFYLLNAGTEEALAPFAFPVQAVARHRLL